ncbi:hypothetical protein EIP86_007695 [Pleurotus ostreatoroseus]|nr:hypothetical protein EIP86_007695 [Pleurotus ostreatoroseus]
MPLQIIYNPVCGSGKAKELFHDAVLPLLREHGREPDSVQETAHAGHAGELVAEFLRSTSDEVSIVLGSGDGTLHEIICALGDAQLSGAHRDIKIVLVPCGTANALYSSLFPPQSAEETVDPLKSLRIFLADTPSTRPLTLAATILQNAGAAPGTKPSSLSAVVASTALHASILHDSEALRAAHPGIERFKMAAQENITRWYKAAVRFQPPCTIYSPSEDRFVPCEDLEFTGPYVYFLSTVNVDRLEPFFRITPLHATLPPPALPEPPTLDVVIVRPLRDQQTADDSESSREQFSQKCMAVLGGAYQDGAHVKMTYGQDGQVAKDGNGAPVVEYVRCKGWEWIPVSTNL